jgi:hypothetical protein
MSDSTRLLTKEELHDKCLHLFKGGLRMVECFTTTAIIILESNIAGITGIYFGLEQWGNFLGLYLSGFERSIENHKTFISTQGYKIAERLTLPLMKNIATVREMCKEGRTLVTLNKLCAFRNHLQFLIQKPNNEWSAESMNVHIYSVTKSEFEKIWKSAKRDGTQDFPIDLSVPKNELQPELQSKNSE